MDRFSGSLRRRYKYILIEPPLPDVLNQGPKNGPLLLELACDGFSKIKRNTKRNGKTKRNDGESGGGKRRSA